MRAKTITKVAGVFLAALLSAQAWGADTRQPNTIATPGTVNYVEGQVSIGQEVLTSDSIGTAKLEPNQFLFTGKGKAEVLLTPGVFLRLGDDSSVQMVSPDLLNTRVALQKGDATVEVTEIQDANNIEVTADGTTTRLLKRGLYEVNADQGAVRVFDGEAMVSNDSRHVKVKAGHEVSIANETVSKAKSFDKDTYEASDLYRWSSLRSAYLAEANADAAPSYVYGGANWFGAGWYWDPWFSAYTFIPGDGIFYSPFGWGFYSPFYAGWAPFGFATDSDTADITGAITIILGMTIMLGGLDRTTILGCMAVDLRRVMALLVFAVVVASTAGALEVGSMAVVEDSMAAVAVGSVVGMGGEVAL